MMGGVFILEKKDLEDMVVHMDYTGSAICGEEFADPMTLKRGEVTCSDCVWVMDKSDLDRDRL